MTTDAGETPLYYHTDHMGSSEFLTSDVTQRVTSWTSYDEWGNITHNAVLKCGTRELDLVKTYTGHERDSVLGQYYAKARMYDTADKHGSTKGNKVGDKRFTAVDPVKGNVRNPQSLVQYTYVLNNPLMYVDPLGQFTISLGGNASGAFILGVTGGAEIIVDDNLNVGIMVNGGLGGATPSISGNPVGTFTTADTIYDLKGTGMSAGGSVGFAVLQGGADFIEGYSSITGEPIYGVQIAAGGFGIAPVAEAHAYHTWTTILDAPKWLEEKIIEKVKNYLDTLTCEERKSIESVIGEPLQLRK